MLFFILEMRIPRTRLIIYVWRLTRRRRKRDWREGEPNVGLCVCQKQCLFVRLTIAVVDVIKATSKQEDALEKVVQIQTFKKRYPQI